ncbi:hypothetical protein SPB21_02145 [Leptothoe sp. ISB3NOV94-8A]
MSTFVYVGGGHAFEGVEGVEGVGGVGADGVLHGLEVADGLIARTSGNAGRAFRCGRGSVDSFADFDVDTVPSSS